MGRRAALACALDVTEPAWALGRLRIPPDAQGFDVPRRAPLTLTPIPSVEEEYNDNVLLTLSDTFLYDSQTNLIAPEAVSVGRDRTFANTLGGSVASFMEPRTTMRVGAAWSVQRFDSPELFDSDVYRANVTLARALTTRLTGSLG